MLLSYMYHSTSECVKGIIIQRPSSEGSTGKKNGRYDSQCVINYSALNISHSITVRVEMTIEDELQGGREY